MESGELGEPMQGKKLLALSSGKEPVLERERTKRDGVWLVTSLNVEKRKSLVGKTPGGVYCS